VEFFTFAQIWKPDIYIVAYTMRVLYLYTDLRHFLFIYISIYVN